MKLSAQRAKRLYDDPVAFATDVLGITPWDRQSEILRAIADNSRVCVKSGHKTGKALHVDTPVFTTDGWKKHGDLVVGDRVFDERGNPCNVLAVQHFKDRPCYAIGFDNDDSICADENHEWVVTEDLKNFYTVDTKRLYHLIVECKDRKTNLNIVRYNLKHPQYFTIDIVVECRDRFDTNCITVDSPSHQYCCGTTMIPTHNSTSIAILALWYAWTRPSARVILTSASARQIKNILWREVTRLYRSAKFDLGGQMFDDPNTGYRLEDGSEILGFSTDQPERMAGISGAHLLFIADEASGIPETIFEAIEGNRAGGARIAMFSNPTETSGTFFDAFNSKKNFWYPIHVSSEETPNVTGKGPSIPGLATREWVEEKRLEHGPDYLNSLWYQVRVLGEFPSQSDYAVIPLDLVKEAKKRNPVRIGTELKAGLDPARFGDDESALAVVRGDQCLPLQTWRLLDGPQLASKVVAALQSIRRVDEAVTLKVDVIGIGASVFDALRHNKPPWLDVVGVNVANAANNPTYHLVRDEVWFSVRDWLRDGGCLPNDDQLLTELVAPIYSLPGGKIKVEPKADTKKRIGRSPDRADSLGLALYQGKTSVKEWVKQAKKLRQVLNMPRKKTL